MARRRAALNEICFRHAIPMTVLPNTAPDHRRPDHAIGCWVQMIPPGEATRPHRHTSSTIYHVVQGEGATLAGTKKGDGKEMTWGAHDCFFVPSWNWHHFENRSKNEPAIIFSVTDRPVLKAGLFRKKRRSKHASAEVILLQKIGLRPIAGSEGLP
jgi:gentisate 1,2-dioxygenase